MKIDELLNRYFEGETSCEEERELRRFFMEEPVPEHLQVYRPLFAYLHREATAESEPQTEAPAVRRRAPLLHRAFYAVSGLAAGVLLLLGVGKILFPPSGMAESYVIIDGKRYTDEKLVEAKAAEALQMVGFTEEDLDGLLFGH